MIDSLENRLNTKLNCITFPKLTESKKGIYNIYDMTIVIRYDYLKVNLREKITNNPSYAEKFLNYSAEFIKNFDKESIGYRHCYSASFQKNGLEIIIS